MFPMEQKCSLWTVFSVFCDEPSRIHYIKEIARKVKLAPTSVKLHLKSLGKQGLIIKAKGDIFTGYKANNDNKNFIFDKSIYNLMNIKESGLIDYLIEEFGPKTIVLYGSYLIGEDREGSDIDMFIATKTKKRIFPEKYEKALNRRIHILTEPSIKRLPIELRGEIINGLVLHGYLKNE